MVLSSLKKSLRVFWLLTLFPVLSYGQFSVFQFLDHTPLQMANVRSLPDGFQLFVPETASQILANPARAANYSRKFFYLHRKTNGFSFTHLSREWLINIDTELDKSENTDTRETAETTPFPTTPTEIFERRFIESDFEDHRLQVSLTNFGRTSFGTSSIGFFALAKKFQNNRLSDFLFHRTNSSESGTRKNRSTFDSKVLTDSQVKQSGFLLGMFVGFAADEWDFTSRFSFSIPSDKRHFESDIRDKSSSTTIDDNIVTRSSLTENETLANGGISQTPSLFRLQLYFRRQAGTANHLFFSLNAEHHLEALIKSDLFFDKRSSSQNDSDPRVDENFQNNDFSDLKGEYRALQLSLGYVLTKKLHPNFYGFIGFNPGLTFTKSRNSSDTSVRIPASEPLLLTENRKITTATVSTPVYLNYTANNWFSVYSIFNIRHRVTRSEIDETPTNADPELYFSENRRTNLDSSQDFFLGFSLRHKSGLTAHIDVSNNLTKINQWQVSVGYHF